MEIIHMNSQQLTIPFEFESKPEEAINNLLSLLNTDRKNPFKLSFLVEYDSYVIACASNKESEIFNVVDIDGKIPQGFCVCWRDIYHINNDLNKQR